MKSYLLIATDVLTKYSEEGVSVKSAFYTIIPQYPTLELRKRRAVYHLVMETIRRMNTIDFILRMLSRNKYIGWDKLLINFYRIATYEFKWETNIHRKQTYLEYKKSLLELLNQKENILKANSPKFWVSFLGKIFNFNLVRALKKVTFEERMAYTYFYPLWLLDKLKNLFSKEELEKLLSYQRTNIKWLRVNTLKSDINTVITMLQKEGVTIEQDSRYPEVLKATTFKTPLPLTKAVQKGYAFIQDRSSVLSVYALNLKPNETVWDACAAPGMKTTLIAQHLQNKGSILATDYSPKRLHSAVKKAKLANAKIIDFVLADVTTFKVNSQFDKLLIDAPCTSTGVYHADPEFKWRVKKDTLISIMALQRRILKNVLENLNTDTYVVYVTCSILPEEGEEQIQWLSENYSIELIETPIDASPGYQKYSFSDYVKRLFPHRHHSKGFFISAFIYQPK